MKKLPAWLIGGIVGLAYACATVLFEFTIMCDFHQDGMCGLFTAWANLPATMLFSAGFVPYFLRISSVFQFATIGIVDFAIGAALFGGARAFWKWQDR